jgi:hypothetical protein
MHYRLPGLTALHGWTLSARAAKSTPVAEMTRMFDDLLRPPLAFEVLWLLGFTGSSFCPA